MNTSLHITQTVMLTHGIISLGVVVEASGNENGKWEKLNTFFKMKTYARDNGQRFVTTKTNKNYNPFFNFHQCVVLH